MIHRSAGLYFSKSIAMFIAPTQHGNLILILIEDAIFVKGFILPAHFPMPQSILDKLVICDHALTWA